jgi:hypothetical protein
VRVAWNRNNAMLVEGRRTSPLLGVKSSPPARKSRLGFGLGYVQDIVCSDIRVDCVFNDLFYLLVGLVGYVNVRA